MAYSKIDKGNLMLGHSVPQFPINLLDVKLAAVLCLVPKAD